MFQALIERLQPPSRALAGRLRFRWQYGSGFGLAEHAYVCSYAAGNICSYPAFINYPQGWTVIKGSNGSVVFIDEHAGATKGSHLAITLGKQGLVHPTSTILNFWQQAFTAEPNYKKVDIAPTAMVGGDSWDQIAATGDEQTTGQTPPVNAELVVMADNHPAPTPTARSWQIQYTTYTNDFAQMNATLFQPMLQSFKFA